VSRRDAARFETAEERALHAKYQAIERKFSVAIQTMDYEKALTELATLRLPVDEFFEHCMVMAEDKKVRANRLALLGEIAALFHRWPISPDWVQGKPKGHWPKGHWPKATFGFGLGFGLDFGRAGATSHP